MEAALSMSQRRRAMREETLVHDGRVKAGPDTSRAIILEISTGISDRGASLASISQFSSSQIVFSPLSALELVSFDVVAHEPKGKIDEDKVDESKLHGAVLVLGCRAKRNPRSVTIDVLNKERKKSIVSMNETLQKSLKAHFQEGKEKMDMEVPISDMKVDDTVRLTSSERELLPDILPSLFDKGALCHDDNWFLDDDNFAAALALLPALFEQLKAQQMVGKEVFGTTGNEVRAAPTTSPKLPISATYQLEIPPSHPPRTPLSPATWSHYPA